MKKYKVLLNYVATAEVIVDAENEQNAIEIASDLQNYIEPSELDITLGEIEVKTEL